MAAGAAFQPAFTHHRVFDAVLGVHLIRRHGDQLIRIRIVLHRLHADHLAVLHDGLECAPVGAGQNAFLRLTQDDELRQRFADGLRQRRFGAISLPAAGRRPARRPRSGSGGGSLLTVVGCSLRFSLKAWPVRQVACRWRVFVRIASARAAVPASVRCAAPCL